MLHFKKYLPSLLAVFFWLLTLAAAGQSRILIGQVRDGHSAEAVPFASIQLRGSGAGRQADSSGGFILRIPAGTDTLDITSVGYQDYNLPLSTLEGKGDTVRMTFNLVPGKLTDVVIVKSKINRGLLMWRRIVAHKPLNDRYRFRNFSYELYNKLELDLKNINRDKLSQMKLLRPFNFILNSVDTAEGVSFLPAYLTESISHYYYQKSPVKRREEFQAVKTLGINNESVAKLTGGMDQNVNIYNNFIPVFDKEFVSPISDNGDAYYNYKIADTQYVGGRRLIHFLFFPRRKIGRAHV